MKQNQKQILVGFILFGMLLFMPLVSAYAITFPAFDLYEVFVENVFGNFWIAVFGLAAIIFIILALVGGLSSLTSMTYCGLFILSMAIGYGMAIITIPLWGFIMFWSITQLIRLVNVQSSLW